MSKPIFIPLAAGVQTELAEQLVDPGSTLVTENCYSPQTGTTRVRLGADILSTATQATIPPGGGLSDPWRLATLNGALVRFNVAPYPVHLWSEEGNAWVRPSPDEGGLIAYGRGPITVSTIPVMAGVAAGAQVGSPDVQVSGGYAVTAHEYSNGGSNYIRIEIVEFATKAVVSEFKVSGAHTPRVCIVGTKAVVAYVIGTNIELQSYDLTTLTHFQTETMGDCDTGTPVDIRAGSVRAGATANDISVIYTFDSGSGPDIMCAAADATDLTSNSTFTVVSGDFDARPDIALGWMQDFGASGKFALICCDSTNGLYVLWNLSTEAFGSSLATDTQILDATAITPPASSTAGIRNVIGTTTTSSASGRYKVLYEFTAPSDPTGALIKCATWNGTATLGTPFRSVGIRSKLWLSSGDLYFVSAFAGDDQKTYFVNSVALDLVPVTTSTPAPLATAYVRSAGGLTERSNHPSQVATGPNGELIAAVTFETRVESIASSGTAIGTTEDVLAIGLAVVTHRSTPDVELGSPVEFAGSVFTPGGVLSAFDGRTYGLAGFPYYPTTPGISSQASGNLEPSAAYDYRLVYSFVDRNGRKWRSAPSTPTPGNTDGTNFQNDLAIPTLRLYDRGNSTTPGYQIEVYRTQANGPGAYFLAASISNDPTASTASLTDNVADADLGEELYTDGGGLENQLLPSISWCVEFQGRLVCGETGTGTIWYSLDLDLNHGLLFNEALTLDIGDASDPTTGAAVYGEQLYVFKAGKVYLVAGQGANALGQGGNYDFRRIGDGVGCSNPQTIAVRDGVWFKSSSTRAGIHQTTGGDPQYVGQGVHAQDELAISSAVVLRDKTEIRWYTEQGTTLVWNWTTRTWGTNTGQTCLTATSGHTPIAGAVYARTDGFILSEATTDSADPYTEGGTPYLARLRSPWYRLGGTLSGWGRVRRIQGVGQLPANHRTVVLLYKNQSTSPFQTSSIVFDETRPRWDWEIRPQQQPMSSLMVEVTIYPYQQLATIAPGDDSYDGLDAETGYGIWTFENGDFDSSYVGATITIVGSSRAGTYTVQSITDGDTVEMSPVPGGGGAGSFVATSISVAFPLEYTQGPNMVGVSLLPVAKDGMDKLPSTRRLT